MTRPSEGRCPVADEIISRCEERAREVSGSDPEKAEWLREIGMIVSGANTAVQLRYLKRKKERDRERQQQERELERLQGGAP